MARSLEAPAHVVHRPGFETAAGRIHGRRARSARVPPPALPLPGVVPTVPDRRRRDPPLPPVDVHPRLRDPRRRQRHRQDLARPGLRRGRRRPGEARRRRPELVVERGPPRLPLAARRLLPPHAVQRVRAGRRARVGQRRHHGTDRPRVPRDPGRDEPRARRALLLAGSSPRWRSARGRASRALDLAPGHTVVLSPEPEVRRHGERRRDHLRLRRQGVRPGAADRASAPARGRRGALEGRPYADDRARRRGTRSARSRRSGSGCSTRSTSTSPPPRRSARPWQVALDEQLVQKVLPRLRGADHRLDEGLQAFLAALGDGSSRSPARRRRRCATEYAPWLRLASESAGTAARRRRRELARRGRSVRGARTIPTRVSRRALPRLQRAHRKDLIRRERWTQGELARHPEPRELIRSWRRPGNIDEHGRLLRVFDARRVLVRGRAREPRRAPRRRRGSGAARGPRAGRRPRGRRAARASSTPPSSTRRSSGRSARSTRADRADRHAVRRPALPARLPDLAGAGAGGLAGLRSLT